MITVQNRFCKFVIIERLNIKENSVCGIRTMGYARARHRPGVLIMANRISGLVVLMAVLAPCAAAPRAMAREIAGFTIDIMSAKEATDPPCVCSL